MLNKEKKAIARFSIRLEHIMDLLEIVLAVAIMIGFLASFVPLIMEIPMLASYAKERVAYGEFLSHAFNLVVGIEFIKMLTKHTPGSVLEVMMFAIARHLVLEGGNAMENLLSVISIGVIFLIKKYIYVHAFTSREDETQLEWLMEGTREDKQKD